MKINTETNKVATRGVQQRYRYTVANTPKLMAMLGDKLYSNKELAPIRELTTNAIDSHIVSGNSDKAIEFSLPTNLDETPTFRIRDYGEGMSEERLINLYRIYGLSSKDDDNLQQGSYGLGSKSPFCYCDNFTTVSYYNGKKYTYVNSKSNAGGFTLNKISECDTMEHNGVEISFPVKTSDIEIFKQNLEIVLKRCPIPYKCNIQLNVEKNESKVLLEDPNKKWIIYDDGKYNPKAIMGYIEYPIDADHFNNDSILIMNVELFFDIGEIEMDISREGLQYNSLTINAIKNRLEEINQALSEMIKKKIESADNLYDARQLYEALENRFNSIIKATIYKWNNQDVESFEQISTKLIEKFGDSVYYYKRWGKLKYRNIINIWCREIKFNDSLLIVFEDISKGTRVRVTQYLRNNLKFDRCLVFDIKNKSQILQILGIDENKTVLASSLAKVTRVRTSKLIRTYSAKKISLNRSGYIQQCDITKTLGQQYYLVSNRDQIKFSGYGWASLGTIEKIAQLAIKASISVPSEIYCVIPSKEKYVSGWKWKKFDDYIKEELAKRKYNKRKICLAALKGKESEFFRKFTRDNEFNLIKDRVIFKKYLKFLRFIDRCHSDSKLNPLLELNNYLSVFDDSESKLIDLKKVEDRIFIKYPFLTLVKDTYCYDDKKKNILVNETINYINLVENQNG